MVRRAAFFLLPIALILLAGPAAGATAGPATEGLLAGAARRAITPSAPVWMAGYGVGPVRKSRGAEGDLFVRALALSQGDRTLVLVSADLIGLFRDDVEAVRALVARARREREEEPPAIIIASTHTHAGPDTQGLWGGIPRSYRERLRQEMALAILEALEGREPVELAAVSVNVAGRTRNRRHPSGPAWKELSALRFYGAGGASIATVVNFAAHPTLLGPENRLLSGDFPGYLAARLERTGGVALYFTGAGGDQSPVPAGGSGFDVPRGYGEALADLVEAALSLRTGSDPAAVMDYRRQTVAVPVTNWRVAVASQFGLIARRGRSGQVETEVWVVRLGPSCLFALPGEALASVGERLRAAADGPFLLLGLANDALGYLVPPGEWQASGYEESLACSPAAADLLTDELLCLAAELAGRELPPPLTDPGALAGARATAWRLAVFIRAGAVAALVLLLAVFTGIAWTAQATEGGRRRPERPGA